MADKTIEEKIDIISRNLDFANSRLVFLERVVRTTLQVDKMPISQGWKRLSHKAGGKLLELVDIICRDHNIPYFLYAGSLIGAKLYGHAVQWDDDWDIGMLREDYELFRKICQKLFKNSKYISPTFLSFSIQFKHKKLPIYGDVFPFDVYYEEIKTSEQAIHLENKLRKAKEATPFHLYHWKERLDYRSMELVDKNDYRRLKDIYNEIIMENRSPHKKGALLENPLLKNTTLNNVYKFEWIFPLKKCKYEGVKVSCPNDTDALLAQKFGDILDLPANLSNHGTGISVNDIKLLNKFIKMDMHKLYRKIKKESNYDKNKYAKIKLSIFQVIVNKIWCLIKRTKNV